MAVKLRDERTKKAPKPAPEIGHGASGRHDHRPGIIPG